MITSPVPPTTKNMVLHLKAAIAFSAAAKASRIEALAFSKAFCCCWDACEALWAPLTTARDCASTALACTVTEDDNSNVFSTFYCSKFIPVLFNITRVGLENKGTSFFFISRVFPTFLCLPVEPVRSSAVFQITALLKELRGYQNYYFSTEAYYASLLCIHACPTSTIAYVEGYVRHSKFKTHIIVHHAHTAFNPEHAVSYQGPLTPLIISISPLI